jgi:serine beta-lactamase-like protein LACTB, mitochondrial
MRPTTMTLVCLLICLCPWSLLPADDTSRPVVPVAKAAKIDAAIAELMQKHQVPGLSVAIVQEGQIVWLKGYGKANLEHDIPVTPATMFRLASVSKPVTALAVLRLVEQGKLDLDAPVQKYVPDFPTKPWPITTRHLLAHLSGIRHYRRGEVDSTKLYPTMTAGLDIFKNDDLLHEPGVKYTYSTYAYTLLGCILEKASGKSFMDCLRAEVFTPARMTVIRADSVFDIIPHRADGYARVADGKLRNCGLADTSYKIPGGGLLSNAEDMARLAIAVQNGKLLKPETMALMSAKQKLKDGKETSYGLGWSLTTKPGIIRHSGGQQGTSTMLHLDMNRNCAVVLLANREGGGGVLGQLAAELVECVTGGAK